MKVTLVLVQSANGYISNGIDTDVSAWASPEDQEHFAKLKQKSDVVVMGRKTYDVIKLKLKPEGPLRVVMSNHPEKYLHEHVPDVLEFSSAQPVELLQQLTKRGYQQVLLASGSELNAVFFNANCVDEIVLTIEPLLFSSGKRFIDSLKKTVTLRLMEHQVLNDKGTLLLKYKVVHLPVTISE